MKPLTLAVFALLMSFNVASAQVTTPQEVKNIAVSFLRRVTPGFAATDLSALPVRPTKVDSQQKRPGYVWNVGTRFDSLTIDDATGSVILYQNGLRHAKVRGADRTNSPKTGRPKFNTEADLVTAAKKELDRIGWVH